jgi:hypothetical protein
MLDVRPTAYLSPLAEQILDDITPRIQIQSFGDEDSLVETLIRIYRRSTGLCIYTAVAKPTHLTNGKTIEVDAEYPWSPPAPADDDYYVLAETSAEGDESGNRVRGTLGAWTFDVKPGPMGPAPAAHHATHELGGMDQVNVAGLTGLLADPQTPATHDTYAETLKAASLDTSKRLAPDGHGGVNFAAGSGGGVTDHALLSHLDYPSAGHTGFAPAAHDHSGDDLKFSKVHPAVDSTSAVVVTKADDATPVLTIDTSNGHVTIAGQMRSGGPAVIEGNTIVGNGGSLLYYSDVSAGVITFRAAYRLSVDNASLGINCDPAISDGLGLHIAGKLLRIGTTKTPSGASDTGNAGEICWDANYLYVCTASNTWKRIPLTW